MPTIGGVNIGWDSNSPPDTESAGLGDDRIRSAKTSIQQAMDAEHNFASGGGANTGYHVFGSARPYYGLQSAVSSTGSDGRIMQTSDSSRLFAVGSGGTVLLGGPTVSLMGSFPGVVPQRHYWAVETGASFVPLGSGNTTITFPNSGFSGIPIVTCSGWSYLKPDTSALIVGVESMTATQVIFKSTSVIGSTVANASGHTILWASWGTRVL